jgi:hypothetical protein
MTAIDGASGCSKSKFCLVPILEAVAALPLMTATDFAARKRWEDRTALYLAA